MPVPITTTLLALAFLIELIGVDAVAAVIGGLGALNQIIVTFTAPKTKTTTLY